MRQIRGLAAGVSRVADLIVTSKRPRFVPQVAARLGITVREYRELEAGARSPSFETWDRICKLFGWPQTFAAHSTSSSCVWVDPA